MARRRRKPNRWKPLPPGAPAFSHQIQRLQTVNEWTLDDISQRLGCSKAYISMCRSRRRTCSDEKQQILDRLFLAAGGDFSDLPGRGDLPASPRADRTPDQTVGSRQGPKPPVNRDQLLDLIDLRGGLIEDMAGDLRILLERPSLTIKTVVGWIDSYDLQRERREAFLVNAEYAMSRMRKLMDARSEMVAHLSARYILDKMGPEIGFGKDKDEAREWLIGIFREFGDWLGVRLADQPELLAEIRRQFNLLIFGSKAKGEFIEARVVGSSSTADGKAEART